jgi:hypothetical protein
MAQGGKRPGAGRKKGSTTRRTRAIANMLAESGLTPLEFMLKILRDKSMPDGMRFKAAESAAPYIHPRLAAVEHSGSIAQTHEDALNALEKDGSEGEGPTPPSP